MLTSAADLAVRHPRRVLLTTLLLVVLGALYGFRATTDLSPAGYEVSGSESTEALAVLAEEFETGPSNVVILVTSEDGVDEAEIAVIGTELAERLDEVPDVGEVSSYWSTGAPQFRSNDGAHALIVGRIVADEQVVYDRIEEIREAVAVHDSLVAVAVGGSGASNLEIVEQSERDLLLAELIAIPLTTLILLFVFRSVVSALLPLIVSAVAVIGTAAALRALSELTLVSVFALNLTTALGLGMAVDYSLFLISRWREERLAGHDPDEALRRSMTTAGRSIFFSGLTTAATLTALLLFDYPLLKSLAVAGFIVVLLAMAGALVILPAAMALLGDRIDLGRVRSSEPRPVEAGAWYRLALSVMGRPVVTIFGAVAVLALLAAPFLRAEFGIPDDRVLPADAPSRQVSDEIRRSFDGREFGAIAVVAPEGFSDVADFSLRGSALAGVGRVESSAGNFVGGERAGGPFAPDRFVSDEGEWLSVVPAVEPISAEGEMIVRSLRDLDATSETLVGGESARLVDNKAELSQKLPFVLLWVAATISALLFWSFRSILMPIKAFVLNLLSLTASFGALVWVFQDGNLSGLLGFTPTGLTDSQTPVLMFCIAFGLSMDYEVFLLSRIKEEWDATGDPVRAVAVGLQRTGGIISAAAVLMATVFLAFATGGVTFIQMVGIGLALSILVDAFIVRSLLVPAFMAIAGRWNWWAPGRPVERRPVRNGVVTAVAANAKGGTHE